VRNAWLWYQRGGAAAASRFNKPIVIALRKFYIRDHPKAADSHIFLGKIRIGNPPTQEFDMIFGTGWRTSWVPSTECKDPGCLEHHSYDPSLSSMSIEADLNGQPLKPGQRFANSPRERQGMSYYCNQSDLGVGLVNTILMRDQVCLGQEGSAGVCVDAGILAAVSEEDNPFRFMPNDGWVGLNFIDVTEQANRGRRNVETMPFYSMIQRLADSAESVEPHFSFFYGQDAGELRFGDHDTSNFEGKLIWMPLVTRGWHGRFWQFSLTKVLVGQTVVDDCSKGCRVIVDSGASRIGAPQHTYDLMMSMLSKGSPSGHCSTEESLRLDISDGVFMEFKHQDYANTENCAPHVNALNMGEVWGNTYILGRIALQHYYMAFDWKAHMIGFAPISKEALTRMSGKGSDSSGAAAVEPQ